MMLGYLAGCANPKTAHPQDPYEPVNRVLFKINDKLDKYAIKPIAKKYNVIVPIPLNRGLDNFFANIKDFPNVINDILQANFYQAASDAWRFTFNTTIGIGGLFDVAAIIGLQQNKNDFGLTLAKWGYHNSSYFFIPIVGPKTIRDFVGWAGDSYISVYAFISDFYSRLSLYLMSKLDDRARLLRFQSVYKTMALDPYVFVRDLYFQHRTYQIRRMKELDDPYTDKDMRDFQEDYYIDE